MCAACGDNKKQRDLFCKLADNITQLCIEHLPREEAARLLINCVEQYQHRHPINSSLNPCRQEVPEENIKRYKEMDKIFRRLREDLRIALTQKELELEMREKELVKLKQDTIAHYQEFINNTQKIFIKFEKQNEKLQEQGLSLGIQVPVILEIQEAPKEDVGLQHENNLARLRDIQKKAVEQIEDQITGQIILKKRVRKEITKYVQQTIVALR